jgi:hypothetical protein
MGALYILCATMARASIPDPPTDYSSPFKGCIPLRSFLETVSGLRLFKESSVATAGKYGPTHKWNRAQLSIFI